MMSDYYVAMACGVDRYEQSDYLYIVRFSDGRVVGYSGEFECCTTEIKQACSPELYRQATWFAIPPAEPSRWTPLTLDEIRSLGLDGFLCGVRADLTSSTRIQPFKDRPQP